MKPDKNEGPIRLVLADVDGTLVTQEKVLTHNVGQVVAQLGQAGILFAITSGQPPRGMHNLIKDLNISTVVAGFDGVKTSDPTKAIPLKPCMSAREP